MISIPAIQKYRKNPLITGTLLLTAAGLLSRFIGFFYRIFLSRAIGAESLGLYQLVFPLLALCLSLTSSGIQTALSRFVAEESEHRGRALRFFYMALFLSCTLSVFVGAVVMKNDVWISVHFFRNRRCAPLLSVMVYSLLPACVHACVNGYYYGLKRATVPSISQLVEQLARVGGVYLIFLITTEQGQPLTAIHAMWGIVIGEFFGLLYSVLAMWFHLNFGKNPFCDNLCDITCHHALSLLCSMAIPLTINRVLINFCTSIENMLIPQKLVLYGMTQSMALSTYGVLNGMTMSLLFFPNVLTGSLSVLLLPTVSEANSRGREDSIKNATQKAVRYGLLLGAIFTFVFFVFGHFLGVFIFNSPLAGSFLRQLCWLCPFLYISSLLGSILHGLGRPKTVLFINLTSCLIRIGFIWLLVPYFGIRAYLWSLLISQIFCALASMAPLRRWICND